ncbi:MAG: ATP-binding protein [Armatimonadota bacterium]
MLRRGQSERAIQRILLWPDRACAGKLRTSFPDLWCDARDRHSTDPVEEAVLRFAEALCAYRAGLPIPARDGFAVCVELCAGHDVGEPLGAMRCAAQWSLALALRRLGDLARAVDLAREAAGDAQRAEAYWMAGAARLALGRVLRDSTGQMRRARAAFDEAHRLLSIATPTDFVGLAYVRQHQARLALDEADASEALSLLREARSGFGRSRHHRALAHSRIDQGWAHVQLRAVASARECGREALQRLGKIGDQRGVLRARKLLARAALEAEHYREAARRFRELAQSATESRDEIIRAEGYVGVARACFAQRDARGVSRALRQSKALLRAAPRAPQSLQGQAIDLAREIRRRRFADVPARLRKLRGALRLRNMPRLTAQCMALCGFELARQGQLREAAPVLREALAAASQPDAVAWTERFVRTVSAVDVRRWIGSLVREIHERASLAEQYEALRICAIAGLHDVNNLLTSVTALLNLLGLDLDQVPEGVSSALDKTSEAGRFSADVMRQLIDERTQVIVAPEPLDIAELLRIQKDSIETNPRLGRCDLDIEADVPLALADAKYLPRIFSNLISNAEKYAPGSDVTLSARAAPERRRDEVTVGFADNGPGIDPVDAEIIFNAFKDPSEYREKRSDRGSGFGLFYCKLVIEAHGGRIWVDPRPGEGAAFYFTLPAAK